MVFLLWLGLVGPVDALPPHPPCPAGPLGVSHACMVRNGWQVDALLLQRELLLLDEAVRSSAEDVFGREPCAPQLTVVEHVYWLPKVLAVPILLVLVLRGLCRARQRHAAPQLAQAGARGSLGRGHLAQPSFQVSPDLDLEVGLLQLSEADKLRRNVWALNHQQQQLQERRRDDLRACQKLGKRFQCANQSLQHVKQADTLILQDSAPMPVEAACRQAMLRRFSSSTQPSSPGFLCAVKAVGGLTFEVLLGHSSNGKNNNVLYIDLCGTVPKIGAGRRLHEHVLSIAKQQGCGISMLRSLDSARTFWSELGYREWSEGGTQGQRVAEEIGARPWLQDADELTRMFCIL
ncbi:stpg1 [Symbiodinium sp. CCMP2592]|nr:stpg1 [Symbiodinium sp. CCMP2592]